MGLLLIKYLSKLTSSTCKEQGKVINTSIRINGAIRASELRVIGDSGEQLGIMSRTDALKAAENAGLDLVEISPLASPPVAKIVDWGKFQYQKMKEQQRNKKNAKVSELKQIRLGMKIGQHDLDIKLKKVRSFLEDGDKVRVQLMYRGRENAHQELGFELMNRIITALGEETAVEQKPQINGRNLSMIVRSK